VLPPAPARREAVAMGFDFQGGGIWYHCTATRVDSSEPLDDTQLAQRECSR
jgi:hypothetical protein